jgi:hypothetical protein
MRWSTGPGKKKTKRNWRKTETGLGKIFKSNEVSRGIHTKRRDEPRSILTPSDGDGSLR